MPRASGQEHPDDSQLHGFRIDPPHSKCTDAGKYYSTMEWSLLVADTTSDLSLALSTMELMRFYGEFFFVGREHERSVRERRS